MHGADAERHAAAWLTNEFPQYEKFWATFIVPLTHRDDDPSDITLKSDDELRALGETPEAASLAELHHSVLLHLDMARDVEMRGAETYRDLFEAIAHLSATVDIADELLGRWQQRNTFAPWSEREGQAARRAWRERHGDGTKALRVYRNVLVHGRVSPAFRMSVSRVDGTPTDMTLMLFPRLERAHAYQDWRLLPNLTSQQIGEDFQHASHVVHDAFGNTVRYLRLHWRTALLSRPPKLSH